MQKLIKALVVWGLLGGSCFAQTSGFTVLPWNGHTAAVSLTFDDARPVHLDVAAPELNKRGLHATFFVVVAKLTRLDDWRRLRSQGHELGNHSVSHEHPRELSKESEETQVEDAKRFLDSNFKSNISIFAYPYTEISPGLVFWVRRYNFAARGGCTDEGCDGDSLYITSSSTPDWYNLPSQVAFTRYDTAAYRSRIDRAIFLHAWTILQIHGIGDPSTGWEPIPRNTFLSLLDYLKACEAKGLWIAPFSEVAAYLRAATTFEHATKTDRTAQGRHGIVREDTYAWEVPENFPTGVSLKLKAGPHVHLYQADEELTPDKNGIFTVAFDAKSLSVREAK